MKKKIIIGLVIIALIGAFVYFLILKEPNTEDTIITDKNGKVIEPIDDDNDNIGH
ncbi:hypothetical protein [Paucisalibacillus globulus]|uniref:hypothetical protein n=1 Tax=Paucisalibacillus globulus TaxID=351095 RepID=UPI001596C0B2|nr:hypothetical protein [Paucisalibacillus globulus]